LRRAPCPSFRYGAFFFVALARADVPSTRLPLRQKTHASANWERRHLGGVLNLVSLARRFCRGHSILKSIKSRFMRNREWLKFWYNIYAFSEENVGLRNRAGGPSEMMLI